MVGTIRLESAKLGEFYRLVQELEHDVRFSEYFRMRPQVFNEMLEMIGYIFIEMCSDHFDFFVHTSMGDLVT